MKLKTSLLLNASLYICPLTFINETLQLLGSPSVAITVSSLAGAHDVLCNMVIPIHFIDGKCIKRIKSWEMLQNLFNQSHTVYITPLVINTLRGGHTDTHTYQCVNQSNFKKSGMRGLQVCTHLD